MFRRLFLKLGRTSKVFLLRKPLLEREGISAVAKSLKKSLLKTEELAPLNRLRGASDAAEDC